MRALAIAATGMSAQQTNVEVIANNLANINTTGFKRGKAEFSDLMYEAERLQGVSNRGSGNTIPEGAQLGLGVRMAAIRNLETQGSLTNTGNTFDLAMQGRGWFQMTGPNGDTVLHPRRRPSTPNASGQLVSLDGYAVSPSIIVPANSTNVTISTSGIVDRDGERGDHADADRTADGGEFRQRDRPPGARLQHVPGDRSLRHRRGGRAGRSGDRHHQPGLSRSLQPSIP